MKFCAALLASVACSANAEDTKAPIAKVLEMLGGLQSKIIGEGEASQKAYDEYSEWCEDTSKNLHFEIKTGENTIAELKATIAQETTKAETLTTKVEELAGVIAKDEADLKAATEVRAKEQADFAAEDAELSDIVDTIGRAIGVLEKEANGGAALLQTAGNNVVQALSVMVKASMLSSADGSRLTALLQSSTESEDGDEDMGAPAAAVYESHSGGIIDVLTGLQEDAEKQLADARKKEENALHNFQMLKQSLVDSIKFGNEDTAAAKKGIAEAGESKATAEGDLDVSVKDLIADQKSLSDLHRDCMTKASDFEASTTQRKEELNALGTAKKIIAEATGAAASFLQVSRSTQSSSMMSAGREAIKLVRDLARQQDSPMLAQLASRMKASMSLGNGNSDNPFGKIKGLISDMIEKLEAQADSEATEKAFCDKELGENNAKKDDLDNDIDKLNVKIDQASARSTQLKEEVATLEAELAKCAKSQQTATSLRAEEKSVFDADKAETEKGLTGLKTALKVLRDYYAQNADGAAQGAGGGIISLLEVCESDFSKALAEMIATEEQAVAVYEQETKDNEMETVAKSQDVKYKTKEHVGLDKAIGEYSKDRSGLQTEVDAVNEYLDKLPGRCIAKPESYADKKKRREAEIAGLKEALEVLGGAGASLLQSRTRHTIFHLRGVSKHA
jgi:hypothetical protein